MIELQHDRLVFAFPEVHPAAKLTISFQRTLRIPDDGKTYPLPPGLGCFPLVHVDDHAERVPPEWLEHGGVLMPMYQSEALWLWFSSDEVPRRGAYPFAIKVATGKINAVSGQPYAEGLRRRPQDYMVAPTQPWLDGYCVEKGSIRQFVAMPLGAGYSAEEQITGAAEHGGLQILVSPMKRAAFERHFPEYEEAVTSCLMEEELACQIDMGLAPGGRMRQEIYEDEFDLDDWETGVRSRCFVHIANSLVWRALTGHAPPTTPFTAKEYTKAGLPWFDYYDDRRQVLEGSSVLQGLKSVLALGKAKGDVPLPENESAAPDKVIKLRAKLGKNQVREGAF